MGKKVPFEFPVVEPWGGVSFRDWQDWTWQLRAGLKSFSDFSEFFALSEDEKLGFSGVDSIFRVQTTPYYAALAGRDNPTCPIRRMIVPSGKELSPGVQAMPDPLGENKASNRPCERLIHRYTDRVLFLATDMCGIYCRYCTRKHFTASDQVLASSRQIDEAISYLEQHPEVKEVIFSGGDPLTIGNSKLAAMIERFYSVPSVELIRIGSRMPVVNPMRIDQELVEIFQEYKPIYMMTHFNHPDEITQDSAQALERLVDHGVPVFNQLVLLSGINNHPALIYALSRRLLYLRVKPYYMFQADPSVGTDHLRISIDEALEIQKTLWGHSSGLAMPQYIVDIPEGGGKAALNPDFQIAHQGNRRRFRGWDGVEADYISPLENQAPAPLAKAYEQEWLANSL